MLNHLLLPPLMLLLAVLLLLQLPSTSAYLKYNEIQQKNSHNSYERREGLLDQMIYSHVRTVEIDAHLGFAAGLFDVYHDAGFFQSYSSFNRLRDGVQLLLEFHQQFPNHHVVTVFMDLKGGLGGPLHSPEQFDDIIGQLPLWTPAWAQQNETSIQAGIDANGWPEIDDLRGKFIWVLTHGQDDYCDTDDLCQQRNSFVAARIESEAEIGQKSHTVFYNQNSDYGELGPAINERGYIGRVYDSSDIDNPDKLASAVGQKFHHIATDRINFHTDPFSKSHNAHGFPFSTLNGVDVSEWPGDDEGGSVLYMYANEQGDAWGLKDNIHFQYAQGSDLVGDGVWVEYTSSVSLVNSHCHNFAKAGIMLREENARYPLGSGPYFGVVRCCQAIMRVQYRERAYMLTVAKRPSPALQDGIEQVKRISIKVRYRYDGKDSHAEGYYKLEGRNGTTVADTNVYDGDGYILIEKHTFPGTKLTVHGLFASSNYWEGNADGSDFKAIFVNTQRDNVTLVSSDFTYMVGAKDEHQFGDGYYPQVVAA